jgi:hypothetical protein
MKKIIAICLCLCLCTNLSLAVDPAYIREWESQEMCPANPRAGYMDFHDGEYGEKITPANRFTEGLKEDGTPGESKGWSRGTIWVICAVAVVHGVVYYNYIIKLLDNVKFIKDEVGKQKAITDGLEREIRGLKRERDRLTRESAESQVHILEQSGAQRDLVRANDNMAREFHRQLSRIRQRQEELRGRLGELQASQITLDRSVVHRSTFDRQKALGEFSGYNSRRHTRGHHRPSRSSVRTRGVRGLKRQMSGIKRQARKAARQMMEIA